MKFPYRSQNKELQALASRSICLAWYPDKKELIKLAQGHSLFKFEDKTPQKLEQKIKKKDWDKIIKFVEKTKTHNFLRIAGDCARVFAIEGKHREDLYKLIIEQGSRSFG